MLQDIKFALRQLRKSPGFAIAVAITLALAIGVNAAVFSMLDGFMLRRPPYPEPQRLSALMTHVEGTADNGSHFTSEDDSFSTSEWREVTQNVPAVIAAASEGNEGLGQSGVNLVDSDEGGGAQFVRATPVTGHYFEVLGIRPFLGRGFNDDESRVGGPRAVVLSYGLWQTMFHGNRSVVGRSVDVKGEPYTVVGVLPRGAVTPSGAELWDTLHPGEGGACDGYDCGILLRLKSGATWQEAQAELSRTRPQAGDYPASAKKWLYAQPLQQYLGNDMKPKVLGLMMAVGFVLLIACANIAGLTLVRISRRTQELATRMALGASRFDILRQAWMEILVLAVIGAGLGLILANGILAGLSHLLTTSMIPLGGYTLDGRVLAFTVTTTVLTSLICGALPALSARRIDLRMAIAASSNSVAGGSRRLRTVLISVEVALTVVLVAASGLLVRTLIHLETLPAGFDPVHVVTATASLDEARYHNKAAFESLLNRSVDAMRRIPGVEDAAVGLSVPYQRGLNLSIRLNDGKNAGESQTVSTAYITPGYFGTLRMPILSGRDVSDTDTAGSEPVAVVNEAFAQKFFGQTDVIGRHFSPIMGRAGSNPAMTIVGVVGNVTKTQGVHWTAPLGTEPVFYTPATQFPEKGLAVIHLWFQPSWIVRTRGPMPGLTEAMQRAMADADPNLPISGFHSMEELMQQQLETQRIEVLLLSVLAGLGLLLSAVGIYALVSNLVVQRTREIGIRMALGSSIERAMVEVGSSGLLSAVAGLLIGGGLSFMVLRVLKSQLYGVGVYDPVALLTAPALLALTAMIASLLPALRISRIDPALTLRSE